VKNLYTFITTATPVENLTIGPWQESTMLPLLNLQSVSNVLGQMPQNLRISTNINPPAPYSML
jgi:hypothetical protein